MTTFLGKMRSAVSPIMLKPSTVNAYTPVVDEIAIEFCDRIKNLRDSNMELPAKFLYELNKWSLVSMVLVEKEEGKKTQSNHLQLFGPGIDSFDCGQSKAAYTRWPKR